MVAALWDVLAKAANLAQISGLHAVMLVAVAVSFLRIPQSNRECAKLERCNRRLRALLQWPTGCGASLLCSEMGGPAVQALVDTAGLVESYKKSTLWHRVWRGRGMADQLRDTRDVVDSYCGLLHLINAAHFLLLQHPTPHHSPSPSDHTSQSPTVTGAGDADRINGIGSRTCNTTDPAACERKVHVSHGDFSCITVQGGDCSQ